MEWTYPVGVLGTLLAILVGLGAVFSLFSNGLLTGRYATGSLLVLVLVAAATVALIAVGYRDARGERTPYW